VQGILRVLVVGVALAACGNPSRNDNGNGRPDAMNDCPMDGAHRCNGSSYETCTGGQWMSAIDCPSFCVDTIGCVECVPGERFCKDGNVWMCGDDGTAGGEVETCTGINVCAGGTCVDACADAAVNKSYIGCEYWAADLDNAVEVWAAIGEPVANGVNMSASLCTHVPTDAEPYGYSGTVVTTPVCYAVQGNKTYARGLCDPPLTLGGAATCPAGWTCGAQQVCVSDAQHSPFAVVVSNPQAKDATVTVTGPAGQTITKVVTAGQVQPILMQSGGTIPDQSLDGSSKLKAAYRLTSDLPVVAYQFNPLDNSNVFSNDASLLIPRATFDTDYYALSWPTLNRRTPSPGRNSYYGYITVIAWQDNTQITVTPTVAVAASATIAPIAAGAATNFTLNAFEVLQLEAIGAGDLTGTLITSPNMMSFGVFGGHEATAFGESTSPNPMYPNGPGFADHLEEMIFPASTWGMSFAVSRSKKRTNEPDVLRIMAQKPGTTLTFTPAPASGTCATLAPGAFCDVKIQEDTEIVASQPVLVGHFLESSTWWYVKPNGSQGTIGNGDPSMSIEAPTEQFRKEYTILVPAAYAENYDSIAAAATGGVTIQRIAPNPMSIPVTMANFPGGGTHRAARVPLTEGQYKITCADGCGITVYGYSDGVSYMFAGGLDLKPIVIF
jgi:hypothetical protein